MIREACAAEEIVYKLDTKSARKIQLLNREAIDLQKCCNEVVILSSLVYFP